MKKWILLSLTAVTFALSGCGKKDDGGGDAGQVPNPWGGYGSCPAGQVYTQYGCLNQGFCPPGQGQYGQTCVPAIQPPVGGPGLPVPGVGANQTLVGELQISDPASFERLLRFGRACYEYRGFWLGLNGFQRYSIRCRDFTYYGRVQVQISNPVDGAPAQIVIQGMSDRGMVVSMTIPMVYRAINGNQGFALIDRSNMNFPSPRVQLTAYSGSVASGQIQISLSFDRYEFAQGVIGRYY